MQRIQKPCTSPPTPSKLIAIFAMTLDHIAWAVAIRN